MEIRALQYFLAVAREENMTEAANLLHVTQPTLSRQIADLEAELGKRLFVRTNRNTILTEEGMHLRQRAEEILSLVAQTEEEVKNDATDLAGTIRIGAAETHSMYLVANLFAGLYRQYPGITCEFFSGNADTVTERLEHGLFDFGLLLEPVRLESYEYIRLPEADRVGIITAAGSRWAEKACICPADVKEMPLLLSSRHRMQSFDFVRWSQGSLTEEDLHVVGRFDLIGNAALLVETGIANAVSIDGLLQEETKRVRFIPFEPPVTTTAVVVRKRDRLMSKTCRAFWQLLNERYGEREQKI